MPSIHSRNVPIKDPCPYAVTTYAHPGFYVENTDLTNRALGKLQGRRHVKVSAASNSPPPKRWKENYTLPTAPRGDVPRVLSNLALPQSDCSALGSDDLGLSLVDATPILATERWTISKISLMGPR
jgi:hypothetical protein